MWGVSVVTRHGEKEEASVHVSARLESLMLDEDIEIHSPSHKTKVKFKVTRSPVQLVPKSDRFMRFVKNCSEVTAHLMKMLRKRFGYTWNRVQKGYI